MSKNNKRLGDILIEAGLINQSQLNHVLELQKSTGKKIGELLIEEKYVEEKRIIEVLEFQLGIPHIDLDKFFVDPDAAKLISEGLAKRYGLIPIKKDSHRLWVAMTDPLNLFAIDDIKMATGLEVIPGISTRKQVADAIDYFFGKQTAEKAVEDFKKQYNIDVLNELEEAAISEIDYAPVVRLVNSLIRQALKAGASDIHIEPFEDRVRVRFRIDGDLQEVMTPEKSTHSAITTRIKIMGKMDIAEKRIPQDGRVEAMIDGRDVDLRISVLPTIHGEKIVIRLLDRSNFLSDKSQLGFIQKNLDLFNKIIKSPNGIILVTGPTGSGKTTTLYSTLNELNSDNKNIITVEDPVEYKLDGINQVQVNPKAGLTFANGLRSILRQDPDIVMIGEIRDAETAEIAVRAAITGHLVLSTMHTNDSPSTITRLIDMGIEPYLVSSAVVGVIAQRLVRRICENCKTSYHIEVHEKQLLDIHEDIKLHKGRGCSQCSDTGYKGRTAIHEVLIINKEIRMLIDKKASIDEIRAAALASGMTALKENCKTLILEGLTTSEELVRTAYSLE